MGPGLRRLILVGIIFGFAFGGGAMALAETPVPPPLKPGTADPAPPEADTNALEGPAAQDAAQPGPRDTVQNTAIPPRPPGRKPRAPLPDVGALIAKHGFQPDEVGFLVMDLETETVAEARNAAQPFIPASVAKVPTALAALDLLGPTYRFETRVALRGRMGAEGVWEGDLWLIGGGDPVLDSSDLGRLLRGLEWAGISAVSGRFLYDPGFLAGDTQIDPRQPADSAYNPGWSALSLDFNRLRMVWDRKGPRGVEAYGTPPVERVAFRRSASGDGPWQAGGRFFRHETRPQPITATSLTPVALPAGQPKTTWVLAPTIPPKGARWLPVKAPAAQTAAVFRALAEERGLRLAAPEPAPVPVPDDLRTVARVTSPPLVDVVRDMLAYSNNLVAELVGATTTRRMVGRPLGLRDSGAYLAQIFAAALPAVDWDSFRLDNHSGLSSDSRSTPLQMATLLAYAQNHAFAGLDFAALLPRRAWRDSAGRLPKTQADYPPVWAKTGTMYYGRGLGGYLLGDSGRGYAFAVFVSDLPARAAFDAKAANGSPRAVAQARGWLARARALERDLVTLWMRAL